MVDKAADHVSRVIKQLYTFKCEVLSHNSIVDASTVSYKGQFDNVPCISNI